MQHNQMAHMDHEEYVLGEVGHAHNGHHKDWAVTLDDEEDILHEKNEEGLDDHRLDETTMEEPEAVDHGSNRNDDHEAMCWPLGNSPDGHDEMKKTFEEANFHPC